MRKIFIWLFGFIQHKMWREVAGVGEVSRWSRMKIKEKRVSPAGCPVTCQNEINEIYEIYDYILVIY